MSEKEGLSERRKKWWSIVAFFFFSGILTATWSSRIPEIQHGLGLTNATLGTVLFSIPLGLVAGLALAGWLVATFGSGKIMRIGCLFCAFVLAMIGFASSKGLLMFLLFFLGVGRTVLNLAANTAAVELQKAYDRPIVATFHGIWSLACFLAAGLGTVMIIFGVLPDYHFLSVSVLVAFGSLGFFRGATDNVSLAAEKRPFFVMPDRYLFLLGLMSLCAMLCEGAMFDWSVNYFEKVVKAEKSLRTVGYLSFIITMAGGRLIGDRLIHFLGLNRMLLVNGLLLAAGYFVAATFPQVWPAAGGFFLIGAGSSILVPGIYLLAARSKKMAPGYAISSVTLIGYTGFLTGPLLIGNVSENRGMDAAFYILGCAGLAISLLAFWLKRSADSRPI